MFNCLGTRAIPLSPHQWRFNMFLDHAALLKRGNLREWLLVDVLCAGKTVDERRKQLEDSVAHFKEACKLYDKNVKLLAKYGKWTLKQWSTHLAKMEKDRYTAFTQSVTRRSAEREQLDVFKTKLTLLLLIVRKPITRSLVKDAMKLPIIHTGPEVLFNREWTPHQTKVFCIGECKAFIASLRDCKDALKVAERELLVFNTAYKELSELLPEDA